MRKLVLLTLLALVLALFAAPAMAQDEVFCGSLAAEDCDLLIQSAETMADVHSATIEFDVQLDVENIPNAPTININLAGTGSYNVDTSVMEALMEMGEDTTAEDAVAAFLDVLQAVDADLSLTLTLPEDLAGMMGAPFSTLDLNLVYVDGVGYIDFDSLDAATGGSLAQSGLTGWGGIDLVDLISQMMETNPEMMDAFSGSFNMGMSAGSMDMAGLENVADYIDIERGDDMDGAAAFVTTVDVAGLVSDPGFQEYLKSQMEMSGQSLSDAEFQQALGLIQMMGSDITVEITNYIDTDTGHQVGVDILLEMDLSTLMAASGQAAGGDSIISLSASFAFGGFNDTSVSAPDGATIAPTEMLLGMMSGSM